MCCFLQVGNYTFTVSSTAGAVTVANNPLQLNVFPAATAADASKFAVAIPRLAVGSNTTVTIYLNDRLGAPLSSAAGTQLSIQGKEAGQHTILTRPRCLQ